MNIYGYLHSNPVNYFDPNGHKEIISNYTTTFTHEVMVDDSGIFSTNVESVTYIQHTYTNLELTVYEDPNHLLNFNSSPIDLNKGNYQWVCDHSNPDYGGKAVYTTNINMLADIDKRAGNEETKLWGGAALSGVSDFISIAKAVKVYKDGGALKGILSCFDPFSIPKVNMMYQELLIQLTR